MTAIKFDQPISEQETKLKCCIYFLWKFNFQTITLNFVWTINTTVPNIKYSVALTVEKLEYLKKIKL